MKQNSLLLFAGVSGLSAVALGAFGAHGLKPLLSQEMLNAYESGVRYQFYHTLAVLFLSYHSYTSLPFVKRAVMFFILGIILFSGSLYLMSLASIAGNTWRWLGPVTPFGGLCFMLGWLFLILQALRKNTAN